MDYSQLSVYAEDMEPFIQKPLKCSWTIDKPQKPATAEVVWATFSTNTYLICQLMCIAVI